MATKEDMSALAGRMDKLDGRMDRMEVRMTKLEATHEHDTQRLIDVLREDYSRVAAAAAKVGDYDEVKGTVAQHGHALESQNGRITALEKKAI